MNVTREVISDLWPVYASGEASDDTRILVEEFLRQDPEFAELLQGRGEEGMLRLNVPALPPDREAKALRRTKRLLHGMDWLLFLAMIITGIVGLKFSHKEPSAAAAATATADVAAREGNRD